jgi:membrane-associated protease RseP (regulator of RpoE activity)
MNQEQRKENRTRFLQILLFVITLITTTLAGAEWIYGHYLLFDSEGNFGYNSFYDIDKFLFSLQFSIAFLGILTFHEFGHYFVARWHQVKVTLPYYIPFWFSGLLSIGTFGAFIRIKQVIDSRKKFFDIGIAGPLAGFVVAIVVLVYGFTHLPPADYIFTIHPEYLQYGSQYADFVYKEEAGNFYIGTNLLFWILENTLADSSLVPNHYEMMHYPFLFAGYLACFFTALNLMPIGQLDGGHILYGLVGGKWHTYISTTLFMLFVYYAGLGIVTPWIVTDVFDNQVLIYLLVLYFIFSKVGNGFRNTLLMALTVLVAQFLTSYFLPEAEGYSGWLVFAFILGRFLGIYHPVAAQDDPLDMKRKVLGYISLAIFILCFTPQPFVLE